MRIFAIICFPETLRIFYFSFHVGDCSDVKKQAEYITEIFEVNDIDMEKFKKDVKMIMEQRHNKINTLVLQGGSNTGKSLIAKLIVGGYNVGTVARTSESNNFIFQNLLGKTVGLMEEPFITKITVNDFKQLLGGERMEIGVKHRDREWLDRVPIICTTNDIQLADRCNSVDCQAINNRCIYYRLSKTIKYGNTRTSGKSRDFFEFDGYICAKGWRTWWDSTSRQDDN